MIVKIVEALTIYLAFFTVKTIFISWTLFPFSSIEMEYRLFLLQCFLNEPQYHVNYFTTTVWILADVFDLLSTTVLTGYIFAYITNWKPKIIFPNKLVIRHRTSGEVAHKLSLGVLIANKSRSNLSNVTCSLIFSYRKQIEPRQIVSDTVLRDDRLVLENYYRFSFPLIDFPREILLRIAEGNYGIDDSITVHIVGSSNSIGNIFQVERKYKLSDIVFDEHAPNATIYFKNPITGERIKLPFANMELKYIDWKEVIRIEEADEEQRERSIYEIKTIVENE